MSHDPAPLSPDERALADALAGATPRGGPPPRVDAAILASARRSVQKNTARRRVRRRWPAALGVAVSLALAVGIAWQLRPAPDQAMPVVSDAPDPAWPAA